MHDLGGGLNSERWSVQTRGPLWRRSAFRSAMGGWRDFVLRGSLPRKAAERGGWSLEEFAEPIRVSRELKGEGW